MYEKSYQENTNPRDSNILLWALHATAVAVTQREESGRLSYDEELRLEYSMVKATHFKKCGYLEIIHLRSFFQPKLTAVWFFF